MTEPHIFNSTFEAVVRRHLPARSRDLPLTADIDLADLGVDSLALVQLLGAIEDEFDTVIPDRALADGSVATPAGLWRAATGM